MRNEMGNNNTSEIIKEEDKASDEAVNHMSPEASGAGLFTNDCSDDTQHLGECSESIEKVKEDREPEHEHEHEPEPEPEHEHDSRFPQILTDLCNPACIDSDFCIAESRNEGINEKIVELNLKESGLQINSQVCISKEMNTGEEVGDSGGNKPAKTNDPDKIHEKIQTLPLILTPDSWIESVGDEIHLEKNEEDFVQQQEEKVLEMDTISEGKFTTHLNSQDNEESEFLAYIESENEAGSTEADSIEKTEIHPKIDDSTVTVKEIENQCVFPDLDKVGHSIEEVSAISLAIVTTENEKATIFSSQLGNEIGVGMIDQTTAETETLSKQSNEGNAIGETSPLPDCDATQELVEEVVIRSNGQKKSTSFDFGIPLAILKSEECDQTTPLLHHDKNASRSSFSGYSNIMPQNNILQNERGVIRMERSDSLVSMDEDINMESSQERKESHFTQEKATELPAVSELALTKQKRRGNRKPKSPLFSTCICCTANFD